MLDTKSTYIAFLLFLVILPDAFALPAILLISVVTLFDLVFPGRPQNQQKQYSCRSSFNMYIQSSRLQISISSSGTGTIAETLEPDSMEGFN